MAPAAIWVRLGVNDDVNDDVTAAQFEAAARARINYWRSALPGIPIVFGVPTLKENPIGDYLLYAGALHHIVQDTPDVALMNYPRICREDLGWGTGSDDAYYRLPPVDRVHHSPAGARFIAQKELEELRNRLVGPGSTTWRRQPGPYAVDYNDVRIVDNTFANTNFNGNAYTEIGFIADATLKLRSIMEVDLSTIPVDATVVPGSLSWSSHCNIGATNAAAYSIYGALSDFRESQATWNTRFSDTLWIVPGGDFNSANALFQATLRTTAGAVIWSGAPIEAYFQSVIDASADRWARVIAKRDFEAGADGFMQIRSREHAVVAELPTVQLQYVPPSPN
jgi:hypothetical protein